MTGKKVFEVVFKGGLVDGFDPDTVKNNIARLFKTDTENLEKLFSGQCYVIKGDLDEQTAQKYQNAMKKAGAICQIREKEPKSDIITAGLNANSIAAPGAILDESVPAPALKIDISSFDVLALGVDMQDVSEEVGQDTIPEIIEASIAPPGENLAQPNTVVEPVYHLEGLSMVALGVDLDEGVEDTPVTLPDISLLELAPAEPITQDDKSESSYLKSLGLTSE